MPNSMILSGNLRYMYYVNFNELDELLPCKWMLCRAYGEIRIYATIMGNPQYNHIASELFGEFINNSVIFIKTVNGNISDINEMDANIILCKKITPVNYCPFNQLSDQSGDQLSDQLNKLSIDNETMVGEDTLFDDSDVLSDESIYDKMGCDSP